MPYNNTPIAPPKEYQGQVSLPLARVKKIIQVDPDIQNCSNNAAFVITIATEMFIQHLMEKTHEIIRAEKRPRRNVQYSDIANAVARIDNLEFLQDVVPRTTTYAKVRDRQQKKKELEDAKAAAQNQHFSSQQGSSHDGQPSAPFTNGQQGQTFNLLEDQAEPMDVDQSGPQNYQPMPSTAEMLEKARGASQRAQSGPSPPASAHPYQPPPAN